MSNFFRLAALLIGAVLFSTGSHAQTPPPFVQISLTPTSLTFATLVIGTPGAAQQVTVKNVGPLPVLIGAIRLSGANGSDFAVTQNCPQLFLDGATCTINVTFKPTAAGVRSASLDICDDSLTSARSVPLTGTGQTPVTAIGVNTTSVTFARQNVGTGSAVQTVTLTNTGNQIVKIASIAIAGTNAADFSSTNTCPASLAVSAACSISLTFKPTAAGTRAALLSISDNANGSPQAVSLTGTGFVPVYTLTVSPAALTFATQNTGTASAAQSVTVQNTGNEALTISSIALGGADRGDFAETNTCPASLAVNGTCSISVTFKPAATGTREASLAISDNATGSPQAVSLTGTGFMPAYTLTVSPAALTFATQNTGTVSAAQSLTVKNTGNEALTISSITLGGANAGDFAETNTCPASLAVSATCSISVTFKPTAAGTRTASLAISDNAPGPPQAVSLSGTGQVAATSISVSPTALTFASQSTCTTSGAQSVTISNTANQVLTISSITLGGANAGDFAETNNCGATLAPGATCSISATFSPTATGPRTASISIADSAAGSPQSVTLAGTSPPYYTYVPIPGTANYQARVIDIFPTGVFIANDCLATPFSIATGDNFYEFNVNGSASSITLNVSVPNATDIYTLMNSYAAQPGAQLGTVTFIGTGGTSLTYNLIAGSDIRDFTLNDFTDGLTNGVAGVTTMNAFTCVDPTNCHDYIANSGAPGTYIVDEQDFSLGNTFQDQTLTQIIITAFGSESSPGVPILLGITVGSTSASQVAVPNVVGGTQAAATTALAGVGLLVGTVTTQPSSTVPNFDVISESPNAGTSVNVGSAVNLVLSSDVAQVSVPNVAGLTQAAATNALAGVGLSVGTVTTPASSTVASGDVISESPAAGTSVNVGSAVNLAVSTGPAQVSVPNVVGETQAAATSALTAVLAVGTVTTQPSSTVPNGDVISESPAAGTNVNIGSTVNLVVSSGFAEVSVPNVVGGTQAAATTALASVGLNVGTVTTQASSTVASGKVISESPTAGTSVNAGSAVSLVISTGPAQVSVPNVVGGTQAAATTALTSAGLIVGSVTTQASSTVASGNVISESPVAGTSVNVGSAVNLVISGERAQVSVPNVVGDTQAVATAAITGVGLVVATVTTTSSATVTSGDVISESPAAGTGINIGFAVSLVISSGPATVAIPNVVGDAQAAATSAITGVGLLVGTITNTASSTIATGSVISETPAAGTSANVGSAVNLVISTGPATVSVPNVLGDTQAAASTAITGAGLVVGTVTTAASSTVVSGSVLSEAPTAGTSANVGSAVNLVISKGEPTGPVPTAINLQLGQFIVTAGASISFSDVAVDTNNNPLAVTPACSITGDPTSAFGTAPAIANGILTTDATTRGVYTLTCSLTNPALTASATFTVLLPTSTTTTTTQQATFAAFSATTTTSLTGLQQISVALTSGNQAAVNTSLAQLQATLNAVNFDALDRSVAFAPEGGFPPQPSELPGFGINPTAADASVSPYLTNLIGALQNLTTFLQTTPLATLTTAQQTTYTQLRAALSSLVAQLPTLNPSTYGIVANLDQEDYLFADVLPQYYQALTTATIQYLTSNGFTSSLKPQRKKGLFAQADGARLVTAGWQPVQLVNASLHSLRHGRGPGMAFQFGGLIELEAESEIQMQEVQDIYGKYFSYLARSEATLLLKSALGLWPGALSLDGIIAGNDSEYYLFYSAPSEIEGDNFNSIVSNNRVYLVGPDQLNAVADAAGYLQGLHAPTDLNDLNVQLEGFVDLFQTAVTVYNEMVQPPNSITFGGCILGNSPPCVDLNYNNGFNSVYQLSGTFLPAPVLVFVQNKVTGAWSTGVFDFLPN